jgi:hypothetical protein
MTIWNTYGSEVVLNGKTFTSAKQGLLIVDCGQLSERMIADLRLSAGL